MTLLETVRKMLPAYSEDTLLENMCPSDFMNVEDINGCDRYDKDRCERCWNREFKEE